VLQRCSFHENIKKIKASVHYLVKGFHIQMHNNINFLAVKLKTTLYPFSIIADTSL